MRLFFYKARTRGDSLTTGIDWVVMREDTKEASDLVMKQLGFQDIEYHRNYDITKGNYIKLGRYEVGK